MTFTIYTYDIIHYVHMNYMILHIIWHSYCDFFLVGFFSAPDSWVAPSCQSRRPFKFSTSEAQHRVTCKPESVVCKPGKVCLGVVVTGVCCYVFVCYVVCYAFALVCYVLLRFAPSIFPIIPSIILVAGLLHAGRGRGRPWSGVSPRHYHRLSSISVASVIA